MLFLIFLVAALAAGATGAAFPPGAWYERLQKPTWVPPNAAFPIVWTVLYVLMAIAGARVAGEPDSGAAMAFWALQIALNALWTPLFFGLRRMQWAMVVMGLLWLAVLGCLIAHWRVDWVSGLMFVPYLAWVTTAGALNWSVLRLNPGVQPLDTSRL
ncbi:tryptophan-rich sensory protein TspO [Wenxinia marina]|uniref:TspO and MBR related protein n=1 Tax=Wenxinia marina DSM 24838 TaxID=1123501 RepID=A0A0D0QIR2_9RHOB|nr:TspO/MBR family protein [Wenxinia marina]KIQ70953.1 TspO and MBR related protein [Wenxinia marina DSM 24838]GGL56034.1 sensory protein TspO [Wenxinia marina]